jgi:predicted ATPase
MQIELENIGLIKEAKVNIDGLTVIAGENDTGKSTIGKALYSIIRTNIFCSNYDTKDKNNLPLMYKGSLNAYIEKLFNNQISTKGNINLDEYKISIENNSCTDYILATNSIKFDNRIHCPILIETPFVWNIYKTLKTIRNIDKNNPYLNNIDFDITPTLNDLYSIISTKLKENNNIKLNIKDIIGGHFQENTLGDFSFNKNNQNIELTNTAMGIKYFGILQVLSDKNHFYNGQILILDEPEVHLHPKWQLELAKVIIELVKGGVRILVNSHSPYMIEALKRYSQIENLNDKTNFYLAQNGYIIQQDNLENIFEKLAIPMRELKNLKIKQYANN